MTDAEGEIDVQKFQRRSDFRISPAKKEVSGLTAVWFDEDRGGVYLLRNSLIVFRTRSASGA
jgi:hypothetical protein